MGGKDGTKAVRDLNVVNVGTTANPEYALLVTGDLGIELDNIEINDVTLPFPEGDDALLKDATLAAIISGGKLKILNDFSLPTGDSKLLLDKTLADLIASGRLKVKLDTGDVVDVSDLATEDTLQDIKGLLKPLTLRESFDESNLDDDVYTATGTYTRDVFGFSIINNNKEDSLTFTIDGKTVPVPPSTSFYDEFDVPDPFEIVVEGDDLDFDAYIKG